MILPTTQYQQKTSLPGPIAISTKRGSSNQRGAEYDVVRSYGCVDRGRLPLLIFLRDAERSPSFFLSLQEFPEDGCQPPDTIQSVSGDNSIFWSRLRTMHREIKRCAVLDPRSLAENGNTR